MLSSEEIKKNAGLYAADLVKPGMTFGLGTGSTVYWLIEELGARVAEGLNIQVVPTSARTAGLAGQAGIPLARLDDLDSLPLAIDGADEIDPYGQLIKGGGGALLQEKIVAAAAEKLVIIADQSKLVSRLGRFPLPVEVIPFGYTQVRKRILASGLCDEVTLRQKDGQPFISDHHHYILDCHFHQIEHPLFLQAALENIAGVVETGLFLNMAAQAIIAYEDGKIEMIRFAGN